MWAFQSYFPDCLLGYTGRYARLGGSPLWSIYTYCSPFGGLTRVNNYQLVHSEYREDGLAQLIRSGDMFTLTTDDPDKKPLPSFKLLELQWILQKITAMSGDDGEPSSDSSSDWVYDWIPPPPLQDSSPDVAKAVIKLQNPDPRGVFYEPLEHLQGSTPIVC